MVPVLVLLTAVLSWIVSLGVVQVRAVDAARETARAVARGDPEAVSLGQRVAPDGARVVVRREGELVVVSIDAQVRGPGGVFAFLPGYPAHAEAVAAVEPEP